MPQNPPPSNDLLDHVTGVILAGGKSRRFGANKALFQHQGHRLIEHPAAILATVFRHRLLVTNTPAVYEFLNWPMTNDIFPDAGPLAGIHAALSITDTQAVFVTACDMPLLQPFLIRYLCNVLEDWDAVVPWTATGPEPLCALYARNAFAAVETALKSGALRVRDILPNLKLRKVDQQELRTLNADAALFANINRREDLKILQPHDAFHDGDAGS